MKAGNAIEVNNITKKFRVYMDRGRTLKELTLFKKRRKFEERLVLNDISFEVKKGEAIGLVGHNGCGKSTTLKLLTRIMYPDSGSVELEGRVSSLIELGAGFHPDMSGRQNIYTNASIFGLGRKEIEDRLDDIIAFSELEAFIDNPVRTYSSGMYMRLAFAVAINVDADILLIDEILAVGDAGFQAKCFDKLKQIKSEGTTIVIVSHSLGQIEEICDRSLWIHEGKIQEEGLPRDVHPHYLEYMGQKRQEMIEREEARKHPDTLPVEVKEEVLHVERVFMEDSNGEEKKIFKTGEAAVLKICYQVITKIQNVDVGFAVYNQDNVRCYESSTKADMEEYYDILESGVITIGFPALGLLPGKYMVDLKLSQDNGMAIGAYNRVLEFEMFSELKDKGVMRLEHEWKR